MKVHIDGLYNVIIVTNFFINSHMMKFGFWVELKIMENWKQITETYIVNN